MYALFFCILVATQPACKTGTEPSNKDCKQDLNVGKLQVLHANDTGSARYFYLETTPAKSTCEADYSFSFWWANPDSMNSTVRPPLADLSHAFAPGGLEGLLFYFPHPVEQYNSSPYIKRWEIIFSIGNKNSSSDTTIYTIFTNLIEGTPQSDSVRVKADIVFSGVGK
ncbi:MAG: hypothetical protein Q8916_03765 [Bacteroidota bacterium]|nr:hypothetical protein [Bacteroidota bacterium]